jgi:UDP-N-acetylmuramate--alanine ligase
MAREFGVVLKAADVVAVLDIYPAREVAAEFPGVSGLMLAEATVDAAPGKPTYWLPDRERAVEVIAALLEPSDVVVVMGAGDIDAVGRALVVNGAAAS